MKTVRHAIDLVQRRLRGDEFMQDGAVCSPQKHRGPGEVRRECMKSADVDSQDCRRVDERRKERH